MVTLVASAARTASGNSGVLAVPPHPEVLKGAVFILDLTAAANVAADTLDVYVQAAPDASAPWWNDVVHFTQALGNGGAKRFEARWERDIAPTSALGAPQDKAIAAGVQQGPLGQALRVAWVVVDGGGHAQSFTFSVSCEPLYGRR